MDTVIDDYFVRISFQRGETDTCIICFTGVGLAMGGIDVLDIQKEEFRKSLTWSGHHIVWVIDKTRSWYSNAYILSNSYRLITRYIETNAIQKVITVGNSMGGTAAICYGDRIKASRCIAFVPQSCPSPKTCPFDTRWGGYINKFGGDYHFLDAAQFRDNISNTLILFGTTDSTDMKHARRFEEHGFECIYIDGCGHDVAHHIKEKVPMDLFMTGLFRLEMRDVPQFVHQSCAFDEALYLQYNPDVFYAVQNEQFTSGYQHWVLQGFHEARKTNAS